MLLLPCALAVAAALALIALWRYVPEQSMDLRVPGRDLAPTGQTGPTANPVLSGTLKHSDGQPAHLPGAWPEFRGTNHDGISLETGPLLHAWQPGEPRELWSIEVGEGYAGAAVLNGRVYLMDYDRQHRQDALRCLSLEDGREIWRYAYNVVVKRNHGMSRTVPAVTEECVVAMGPKCHVLCCNPVTGELRWGLDLVREYGTKVPQWYAGQCPLIDGDKVILAPGGPRALLLALDCVSGKVAWQTPNPHNWKMTHSSIVPMDFGGERMYIYCADKGVVGVSAADGRILWETTDWKISIATVPSPLIVPGGRLFLCGGYDAGSLMLQLSASGGNVAARPLFKLEPEVFGATQHTPILFQDHIYGVRPDGRFVCLTLDGKGVWDSGAEPSFGLGPFLMCNGLIFAMNDSGLLRLIEATPERFHVLAQAQVLKGRESWGAMALAGGRLIARDLTRMVCLDVSGRTLALKNERISARSTQMWASTVSEK